MVHHQAGTIVTTEISGQVIRFFVKDPTEEIQKYHYAGNFYEAEELEILKKYYRKGDVFVDIGANIGNHAIFAEKILDAPEVIVFEPNPEAIAYMELNLLLNGCSRINKEYLGFPIADVMGIPMKIVLSPANNLGNTVFGKAAAGSFRTITGDFALRNKRIGIIKIDTEEMEFEALNGLKETLDIWQPRIFVEVVEAREPELIDWTQKHGYQIAESQKRYQFLRNYVLIPS